MKGYTVFNVEQIDGLPSHYYQLAEPVLDPVERIDHAESFSLQPSRISAKAAVRLTTA